MRRLAIVALLLVACAPGARVTLTPSPSATPSVSLMVTATAPPRPVATEPPFRVLSVGVALPRRWHYYLIANGASSGGTSYRLLALDVTGGNTHIDIASWSWPARVPSTSGVVFSASADGSRIAFVATGSSGATTALYLLDRRVGQVRTLFDDPTAFAKDPVLSADGSWIGYLRLPARQDSSSIVEDGIFADGVDFDPRSRVWGHYVSPSPPFANTGLGWSPDDTWLTFSRGAIGGRVWITRGAGWRELGDGTWANWRTGQPRLLFGGDGPKAPSSISTYDDSTGVVREIYRAADASTSVTRALWSPTDNRFLYVEIPRQLPTAPASVWVRDADGSNARKIASESFLTDVWWSVDGTQVLAILGGDDSTFPIVDLISGKVVGRGCWRGDPRAATCA